MTINEAPALELAAFVPNSRDANRLYDRAKWNYYEPDVLPMWVADMDFLAPQPVIDALTARAAHGIFGYQMDSPSLKNVLVEYLESRLHLSVQSDDISFTPGLVSALLITTSMIGDEGDGVLVNTPMYPPFLMAPDIAKRELVSVPLASTRDGSVLHYEIDFDALEAAVTPRTKLWLFCNPHNPVGRAYTRAELERVAEFCLRHDLIIASDEIHSELVFDGHEHIAIASLSPEIAARTITLNAPSKAFNVPGLDLGFAVVTDPQLREQFQHALMFHGGLINVFGYVGAQAAYTQGRPWLVEVMRYLHGNRDLYTAYMRQHFPQVPFTIPEATYLAWMDFSGLTLADGQSPSDFFLKYARVGMNDGKTFGGDGEGFVRLNFGCARETLLDGLERMRAALEANA